MSDLVQIKNSWHRRRLKATGEEFEAKKSDGGGIYLFREKRVEGTSWCMTKVMEELSEEIK